MKSSETNLPLAIVMLQLTTALVVAGGLFLLDAREAESALLAGATIVIPGGYFAWRARVERSPGRLLAHGMMKFVSTVALMALSFAVFDAAPLGFFSAFVLMQAMYVIAPLLFADSQRPR
ncbi:MAG: ATP synthase subunit I [Pseudomonadales bacterium]